MYLYILHDLGVPFYVGITQSFYRATKMTRRNRYCNNVISQLSDEGRQVLRKVISCPDREFAIRWEKRLIARWGRRDNNTGLLCNLTDGGEATSGWIVTAETRAKISQALDNDFRNRSSEGVSERNVAAYRKNMPCSEEHRKKLSIIAKERIRMKREGIPFQTQAERRAAKRAARQTA